jgi:hypothetical protein
MTASLTADTVRYRFHVVGARTASRTHPAFSLKDFPHSFPEYRASVLPIYKNSAGKAALQRS